MKTLASIIEDPRGVVVGAIDSDGVSYYLEPAEQVPRARLGEMAAALAEKYGFQMPGTP